MKKLLIDCDQVFDVLTRGPFPSGSSDDEGVEHHLRACHECRQLAEALRPAVELLHEAVAANEAQHLPGYRGALPAIALSSRGAVDFALRPADRCTRSLAIVRLLAASVLATALSLLVYGLAMSPQAGKGMFQVRGHIALAPEASNGLPDGIPDQHGLLRLVSLQLPSECFSLEHRQAARDDTTQLAAALASGSLEALRCCTECHRAGQSPARGGQLVALAKESCQACHRG